jgi:hypothetical protein
MVIRSFTIGGADVIRSEQLMAYSQTRYISEYYSLNCYIAPQYCLISTARPTALQNSFLSMVPATKNDRLIIGGYANYLAA